MGILGASDHYMRPALPGHDVADAGLGNSVLVREVALAYATRCIPTSNLSNIVVGKLGPGALCATRQHLSQLLSMLFTTGSTFRRRTRCMAWTARGPISNNGVAAVVQQSAGVQVRRSHTADVAAIAVVQDVRCFGRRLLPGRQDIGDDVGAAHSTVEGQSPVPVRVAFPGPHPTPPEFRADDWPVPADLRPEADFGREMGASIPTGPGAVGALAGVLSQPRLVAKNGRSALTAGDEHLRCRRATLGGHRDFPFSRNRGAGPERLPSLRGVSVSRFYHIDQIGQVA